MNLLAIYTASEPASAALVARGGSFTRTLRGGRTNEELAPAARELLEEAGLAPGDLEGVAVARGPGSFTGLRLGAATAMGLARGAKAPLFAAATLELWAASAARLAGVGAAGSPPVKAGSGGMPPAGAGTAAPLVRVVLDARRGEVYAGGLTIRDGIPVPFDGPVAMPPADALARIEPDAVVVGDGRRLLLEAGMDPRRPGFEQPPEPLAVTLARLVARDPARHACGAGGLVLDYVRRPQAVEALAGGGTATGRSR